MRWYLFVKGLKYAAIAVLAMWLCGLLYIAAVSLGLASWPDPPQVVTESPTVVARPTVVATPTIWVLSIVALPCSDVENTGQTVACKIPTAYCEFLPLVNGSPTFCNDKPYPNQRFTLVVFGQDWSGYDGECLIVTGRPSSYEGTPQIIATSRSQVRLCEDE